MKRLLTSFILGGLLLQGCRSEAPSPAQQAGEGLPPNTNLPPPPLTPGGSSFSGGTSASPDNDIIATVRGDVITRRDLEPVLIEAYGLNVLLTLVQLDLVEQEAARQHIVVTPQDVNNERSITLDNLERATQQMESNGEPTTQPDTLTAQQKEQLLGQLLEQQHVSKAEFNLILQVNAYLRKIAEPKVNANITEDAVRKQFNALYGERVVVHYIVCNSMSEVAEVRAMLAKGQSFEEVARLRSRDRRTAATGGELPPFTLADNRFPDAFKQVVFNLKVGEVSDPVEIGKFIYIAKLIDRIPPAQARFEDYRVAVRKDLYDNTVQAAMKAMRDELARMALSSLHIKDPVLAQQWADKINNRSGQIEDQNQIRSELDREHAPPTTQQSSPNETVTPPAEPGTPPTVEIPAPAGQAHAAAAPAASAPSAQPPATRPATAH